MKESTLIEIMKVACKHWQEHIADGTLPEDTTIHIGIDKNYVRMFGMAKAGAESEHRYVFSVNKGPMDKNWHDNTERLNRYLDNGGVLREPIEDIGGQAT